MATRVRSAGSVLGRGLVAGVFGGVLFILVEMAISVAIGLPVMEPFRVIGSIVQGPAALSPGFPVSTAVASGLVLHFLLSALYGMIFTAVLHLVWRREIPSLGFLVLGISYAVLLWILNFLVIAPVLSPQIATQGSFLMGFTIAHAAYGLGLGGYVAYGAWQVDAGATGTRV